MSMGWRWRDEVREDGLWESAWRRWLVQLVAPVIASSWVFLLVVRNGFSAEDGWVLVPALAIGMVFFGMCAAWRDGVREQLVFGVPGHSASLVAGRERIGLWRIERLVVYGPLARREVTVHLQDGMPTILLKGWTAQRRALAEQWLTQRQNSLPFPVAIEAPESPFLQPDTLI